MSTLVLVRHGQATPFAAETDRLSPLGVRQAGALAAYWTAAGVDFDEVRSGTLERQRRTAEVVSDDMLAAGRPWPATAVDAGLDEYDGDGVFGVLARTLAARDERFGALAAAADAARGTIDQNRRFQHMAEYVADRWMRGDVGDPVVETWPDFCTRVDAAVDRVLDGGGGRRVVAFTSGGVIGRTLQRVLRAPDETALALNWRIRNASVTSLTFSAAVAPDRGGASGGTTGFGGHRVSLDTFNVTAHLEREGIDSYR